MAVPDIEFTPLRAPRGRVVHAVTLNAPTKTACGKVCRGWLVATTLLGCPHCKTALLKIAHGR